MCIQISLDLLNSSQMLNIDTDRLILFHAAQKLFATEAKYGENPDVFW